MSQATDSRAPQREPTISDAAVDAAGCLFVVLDADGRIRRFNPAASALTGVAPAEARGRAMWDVIAPDAATAAAALRTEVGMVVSEGARRVSEHHCRTHDGALRRVAWSLTPIVDADGEVALVVASGIDITEQRRAEAASGLLQRVAMAANEAPDVDQALAAALAAVCAELGWRVGRSWRVDDDNELRPTGRWHVDEDSSLAEVVAAIDAEEVTTRDRALVDIVRLAGQPLWAVGETATAANPTGCRGRLARVGLLSAFALPVMVGHEVVGVLEFFAPSAREFDAALIELMRHVGAQVGRVVERDRARLEAAANARAEAARLDAIVQTQLEIATMDRDLGQVMLLVVERVMDLTDAAGASLELSDEDELVTRAATGIAVDWVGRRNSAASLGGRCTQTHEPVVCDDIAAALAAGEHIAVPLRTGSFVTAPLLHQRKVVGLMRVVSSKRRAFTERHVNTVRVLAGLTAVAMDQALDHAARQQLLAERTAALAQLSESEERFRKAFDDAPIGMALVSLAEGDEPGSLLQVNRALAAMTGRAEGELLDAGLLSVVHEEDRLAVRSTLRTVASDPEEPYRSERRLVRPDGKAVWVAISASAVVDGEAPRYAIVQVEDISQRKDAEAKLTDMALHDPLTGLPNRLLLLDRVQRALARARRRHTQVALLFCDLDRFKVINDSLGHETGDALLVAMARRFEGALRDQDTAARLGGDEFVVVCEDVVGDEEAMAVAQRLQDVIGQPCEVEGGEVVLTTSVGIVMSSGYASPYALLRDADAAMYRAKESGRARVEVFDQELAAQAVGRLKTERGLRRALEHDEFRLFFQPLIGLRSGTIEGFEALLRWDDPDRGLVTPDQFLEVAEETGLIVPIGKWVLEEACRQVASWRRRWPTAQPWSVAVNLSARQVARSGLVGEVAGALEASGLDPSWLCLELTESVLIEATTQAMHMLGSLKGLGVRLAIDDFGTGYSSLSYLRRFPVDVVKVDRSFVAGLGRDGEDDAIVAAVIGLTQRLGLQAVAEGVETEEQSRRLRELGCDLAQGYLFARPQPPEAIEALLAAGGASSAAS